MWVDGKQTVVVYSTIAARELETVVHSMAHVSLPELDALVAASRPVSNAVTSESRGFFYPLSGPDFPAAPSVHIVQDNPDSLFSCVTLDPRGDRHETCSQSDAIVAVYGQIVSSAGSVRIGGLVNSTVAAIRVVPDIGKPVPVLFVADQRMTNGRQLFYGELQRGIRGDVVEFIGPDGDVVARRYWRAPSFKVSDASYVVPTGGSTATEFDGVRVSATDRRFVDGSFSECNGIEFTSTKGLVLVGSLGCSEVPVDDTAAIPEGFSIASSGYRFTAAIVPTDAVTAELVFATQRIKPLTILKTNRQRLVVDRRSPTDEAPLEIRYLGRDGRIVATIGFWYDQSSVPSSK